MSNLETQNISICLPIFNEAKSIKIVIDEWTNLMNNLSLDFKIICSEDGSTDKTKEILLEIIKQNPRVINNISHEKRGYTKAVISGIDKADTKYILCVDSDGQCDPADFESFWANKDKLNKNYFLIGNRFDRKDGFFRHLISKLFKLYHKILFPNNLKDPSCPYVFFKKKSFNLIKDKLHHMHEGFWWGFVGCCLLRKINFFEIKINHRKRIDGETNVYKFNKIPMIAIRNAIGLLRLKLGL